MPHLEKKKKVLYTIFLSLLNEQLVLDNQLNINKKSPELYDLKCITQLTPFI